MDTVDILLGIKCVGKLVLGFGRAKVTIDAGLLALREGDESVRLAEKRRTL